MTVTDMRLPPPRRLRPGRLRRRHRLQQLRRPHRRDAHRSGRPRRPRRRASTCSTPPTSTARPHGRLGGDPRRGPGQAPPRRGRHRHQVRHGHRTARTAPTAGAARLPPVHHPGRRGVAAAGSAPTTSTSTRSTCPTSARRSRRRCGRSTTWSAPARSATSATPTTPAGRSPTRLDRPDAQPHPVHQRAEPVQPARPRRRARGRAGLRALRPRPAAVLPAGQRPAHRQVPARRAAAGGHPPGRLDGYRQLAGRRRRGTPSRRSSATPPKRGRSLLDVAIGGLAARPGRGERDRRCHHAEQVRANAAAAAWRPEDPKDI